MKNVIVGLLTLLSASVVMAADSSSGCGMGWEVAPKQSLVSSSVRSIVNATFSSTVAMTMGTSGCAKHSIVKNEAQGIHFAEASLNQLSIEMARGNGDYVTGFASVFGCQDSRAFGSMMQAKYESLLPSEQTSGVERCNNVKSEIKKNATLASSCTVI